MPVCSYSSVDTHTGAVENIISSNLLCVNYSLHALSGGGKALYLNETILFTV